MIVVLVSCAKRKHDAPVAARELYLGRQFRAARRYAERQGDWWFILSAKHGLVDPSTVLAPYDLSMHDLTASERRAWGHRVVDKLDVSRGDYVIVLAGRLYTAAIVPLLDRRGLEILCPLAGKDHGARWRWLVRDYAEAS